MNKACHHDRLFNWKLFKHVDILAKTLWVQRYGDSPTFAIPKTWDFYLDRCYQRIEVAAEGYECPYHKGDQ